METGRERVVREGGFPERGFVAVAVLVKALGGCAPAVSLPVIVPRLVLLAGGDSIGGTASVAAVFRVLRRVLGDSSSASVGPAFRFGGIVRAMEDGGRGGDVGRDKQEDLKKASPTRIR